LKVAVYVFLDLLITLMEIREF